MPPIRSDRSRAHNDCAMKTLPRAGAALCGMRNASQKKKKTNQQQQQPPLDMPAFVGAVAAIVSATMPTAVRTALMLSSGKADEKFIA